ncbi:conserved hypothetical protein [Candidatus Nitrotoga sp. HW29]|uniref:hypothetical protein n=1 Tax=Candidatus Nitrotoga sp. HW29 TaxID=2886963 RepID=UPI001EF17B4D|nr:hypothetical protein [Candidatus Nitrotoga sp. HW29]CAH1906188.1 conserved hypothetical protein [Candidatus Nitrotoga sp. HW29]
MITVKNIKGAIFILALMIINTAPVLAETLTLIGVTGNSCNYSAVSIDSSGNLTATCVATLSTLTPTCSLIASPSTINAGSISTLTASCSPAATSYAWTGAGTTNFTSGGTVTPTATTTYTVRGTNEHGSGNTASATVIVTTTPPPGNGGGQPPTPSSPIAEIKRWNYAFETVNKYPFHDTKQEPVAYMAYNKLIQSLKPTIIFLPTSW